MAMQHGGHPSRPVQVGDEDRERVVAALRAHFAEGRLGVEEFGERVEQAYAAASVDDLARSLLDLPGAEAALPVPAGSREPAPTAWRAETVAPAPAASRDRVGVAKASFYAHLGPYVVVNLFLIILWALTSFGGYFWPIWPMMGWGIGLGIHAWAAFVVAPRKFD